MKRYYENNPEAKKAAIQRIMSYPRTAEFYKNCRMRKGADSHMSRSCICIETQEVFVSATEAAEKYGGSYKVIWKCCKGQCTTAAGFHWAFLEDKDKQLQLSDFVNCSRKIFRESKIGYKN